MLRATLPSVVLRPTSTPELAAGACAQGSDTPPLTPHGGRTWWAHLNVARIIITPTILRNQIEEFLNVAVFDIYYQARVPGPKVCLPRSLEVSLHLLVARTVAQSSYV